MNTGYQQYPTWRKMTQYTKHITKAVQKYRKVSKPIKTAHSILG